MSGHPVPARLVEVADGQATDPGTQAHLRQCDGCAAQVEGLRRARHLVRRGAQPTPAPADLVSGLRARYAAPPGGTSWPVVVAALAVLGLVASVIAVVLLRRNAAAAAGFEAELILQHVRHAAMPDPGQVAGPDAAAIERWLQRQLERPMPVPRIEGAIVVGARIVRLKGRAAALIFYELGGRRLSVYGLPLRGGERSAAILDTLAGACGPEPSGYTVCTWSDSAAAWLSVSELDPAIARRVLTASSVQLPVASGQ